jgi:non-ribosomal peptide synthetase component F
MQLVHSLKHIGACSNTDTILQMAECSFDDHVGDIFGAVTLGATLIMLRPRGIFDLEYLTQIIEQQQITSVTSVPSLFDSLFRFVEHHKCQDALKYIKFVSSGGMYFNWKLINY